MQSNLLRPTVSHQKIILGHKWEQDPANRIEIVQCISVFLQCAVEMCGAAWSIGQRGDHTYTISTLTLPHSSTHNIQRTVYWHLSLCSHDDKADRAKASGKNSSQQQQQRTADEDMLSQMSPFYEKPRATVA
jgi:hypothetical protein